MLRTKRKSLDMTLEEVAKKLNVGINTIHQWETAKRIPCANRLWDIKLVYQLSDEELMKYLKEINKMEKDK